MNKRELQRALDDAVARVTDLERRLNECTEAHHRTCATEAEMEKLLVQLAWCRERLAEVGVGWQPQKVTR